MRRRKFCLAASLCAISMATATTAQATIAFSENFDTGVASFTTDDPYWTDPSEDNGFIVRNTGGVAPFSASQIAQDASGSGYFLFEGTTSARTVATDSEFYISSSFAVVPNTTYTVSFALTNADPTNVASVQPEIGSVLLGTQVSANDDYSTSGWQTFDFTWNSGSSSTADLILNDYTVTGFGNDFGVDSILVQTAIPEPASLLMLGASIVGLGFLRRRVNSH
jgi:hypothetical protein